MAVPDANVVAGDKVCTICLCFLYSVATFEGWRIVNVELYAKEVWRDYGIPPIDLHMWTFEETDARSDLWDDFTNVIWGRPTGAALQPPPHHRFPTALVQALPRV